MAEDKYVEIAQPLYGVKEPVPFPGPYQPEYGVNVGLDMGTATYARSKAGMTALKNDFDAEIQKLIKVLNGDKYAQFKRIVNQNWVGADAEDFLSDIEKTRASLQKQLLALRSTFNSAMDNDIKQFANFQKKNVK